MAKRFKAQFKVYSGCVNYCGGLSYFVCIGQFETVENAKMFFDANVKWDEEHPSRGCFTALVKCDGTIVNTTHPLLSEELIKNFI